jgi:hypothetical protein
MSDRPQRGQALTEYVLVGVALAAALFTPWLGGRAPLVALVDALGVYLRSFHTLLSLPVP